MILDISIALNEARLALQASGDGDRVRCGRLRDGLLRDARNPLVMGDQREQALRLATLLSERLEARNPR